MLGLSGNGCSLMSRTTRTDTQLYLCDPGKGEQMVKLPGWESAWQIVNGCDVARATSVSIAMKIFYLHWLENFGDYSGRVEESLQMLMVMWGTEFKTTAGYRMDGTYGTKLKAQGLAHSKSTIWVKKSPGTPICKTSLVHELVHIAIWANKRTDGDPDHLGGKYLGWTVDHSAMIDAVKRELCRLEI